MNAADNMASEYCVTNRNKVSTKNEVSCDGCCRATFYVKLHLIDEKFKKYDRLKNVKKIYYTSPFGFFIIIM